MLNSCREIAKKNYELDLVKYQLQGKKVRENPLLSTEETAPGGAFGQQSKGMFLLDKNVRN